MRSKENSILEEIPKELDVVQFAASRAAELEAMAKAAAHVQANKLVNQSLPRHMRRRAASHNAKRLPCRAREAALREWQKNPPGTTKRPSRRHRRRPSNLLHEYHRRKRQHVWLETHIWHAKRFHMTELYGYKLAQFPNDKSVRALHRACTKYSTLYDISYYCCVEIFGTEKDVVGGLSHLTGSDCGVSFAARMYQNGHKEGRTILYKMDQYPKEAIGPAWFMWKPLDLVCQPEDGMPERFLWLWVHPAMYTELLDQLQSVYDVVPIVDQEMEEQSAPKKCKMSCKDKLMAHDALMCPNPVFKGKTITVTSLKDTICRYRLNGPLSHKILSSLLHPADVSTAKKENYMWWNDYYSNKQFQKIHSMQQKMWEKLQPVQSPGELPAHAILALTVKDPRLFLPAKKTVVDAEQCGGSDPSEPIMDWPVEACVGPIWQKDIREKVKMSRTPDAELNKLRSQHLLPGTELKLGENESRIPVVLIQHPGLQKGLSSKGDDRSGQSGYGSGWDLVVPAGWGMAFWLGLVYRGARVGGLRDLTSCWSEQRVMSFPQDFPDTLAGQREEDAMQKNLQSKHERMPPAKRPNHVKLGFASPFKCPWSGLVEYWSKENMQVPGVESEDRLEKEKSSITVLRGCNDVRMLSTYCNTIPTSGTDANTSIFHNLIQKYGSCLVAVFVECKQKGTPVSFSSICLPNSADLEMLSRQPSFGGPIEPLQRDPRSKMRKKKCNREPPSEKKVSLDTNDSVSDNILDIKCTRKIIGYVKHGHFSLTAARGCGLGFIALPGLTELLQQRQRSLALVRSPSSLQYRFVYLSVIC